MRSYIQFCAAEQLPLDSTWPAPPDTICLWMTALASRRAPDAPLQHRSIKYYLAALNTAHEVAGLPPPTRDRDCPRVARTLKGIKREQGTIEKRPRLPITVALLRQMQPLLDPTRAIDRLIWAAMCTATCALLRLGELTVDPQHAAHRTLRLQDLALFTSDGACVPAHAPRTMLSPLRAEQISHMQLTVRASKTDPFSKGACITIATPIAIAALLSLLCAHPRSGEPHAPIFAHSNGAPLQRRPLVDIARTLLAQLGHNPDAYAGHSFRKGGASSLAAAGVAPYTIQTMGRWASNCYQLYIDLPIAHTIAAGRAMV